MILEAVGLCMNFIRKGIIYRASQYRIKVTSLDTDSRVTVPNGN